MVENCSGTQEHQAIKIADMPLRQTLVPVLVPKPLESLLSPSLAFGNLQALAWI